MVPVIAWDGAILLIDVTSTITTRTFFRTCLLHCGEKRKAIFCEGSASRAHHSEAMPCAQQTRRAERPGAKHVISRRAPREPVQPSEKAAAQRAQDWKFIELVWCRPHRHGRVRTIPLQQRLNAARGPTRSTIPTRQQERSVQ